ncbi:hypothetical protein TSUD_316490 [Trifolium subterraneum]|uniref:Uncharacterized protein n=1 Tax=Trifolium subterraneum TaxID=3900 RepID=A0A2Z6N357_TRISU|nr:hypothetical protein TSUD_316490 [Trifolium subterraneum]
MGVGLKGQPTDMTSAILEAEGRGRGNKGRWEPSVGASDDILSLWDSLNVKVLSSVCVDHVLIVNDMILMKMHPSV